MKANISTCHERGYFETKETTLSPLDAIIALQKEYDKLLPVSELLFDLWLSGTFTEEEDAIIKKAEEMLSSKCSEIAQRSRMNLYLLDANIKESV